MAKSEDVFRAGMVMFAAGVFIANARGKEADCPSVEYLADLLNSHIDETMFFMRKFTQKEVKEIIEMMTPFVIIKNGKVIRGK